VIKVDEICIFFACLHNMRQEGSLGK